MPATASCRIAVSVKTLLIEPMLNSVVTVLAAACPVGHAVRLLEHHRAVPLEPDRTGELPALARESRVREVA